MASSALRCFDVTKLGGEQFTVSVTEESTLGDLLAKISKETGLAFCFSLISATGEVLIDPAGVLPKEGQLQCVVENLAVLCNEAQELLKSIAFTAAPQVPELTDLCLGSCRWLGSCRKGADVDKAGSKGIAKDVYELTLLDGENKCIELIGVIRPGRMSYNSGMTGPIYLRPGFKKVGELATFTYKHFLKGRLQHEEHRAEWVFNDVSWYKEPKSRLPSCRADDFGACGEFNATSLQTHLAHALLAASNNRLTALEGTTQKKRTDAIQAMSCRKYQRTGE